MFISNKCIMIIEDGQLTEWTNVRNQSRVEHVI